MIQQTVEACLQSIRDQQTVIAALWPPTERGRIDVAVGDCVLFRFSILQDKGILGMVVACREGEYTIRLGIGLFSGVLQGHLQRVKLELGQEVDCEYGRGTLCSFDDSHCTVQVGANCHRVSLYSVIPDDPKTGYDKNATDDLMRRHCGLRLNYVDALPGRDPPRLVD